MCLARGDKGKGRGKEAMSRGDEKCNRAQLPGGRGRSIFFRRSLGRRLGLKEATSLGKSLEGSGLFWRCLVTTVGWSRLRVKVHYLYAIRGYYRYNWGRAGGEIVWPGQTAINRWNKMGHTRLRAPVYPKDAWHR